MGRSGQGPRAMGMLFRAEYSHRSRRAWLHDEPASDTLSEPVADTRVLAVLAWRVFVQTSEPLAVETDALDRYVVGHAKLKTHFCAMASCPFLSLKS